MIILSKSIGNLMEMAEHIRMVVSFCIILEKRSTHELVQALIHIKRPQIFPTITYYYYNQTKGTEEYNNSFCDLKP